MKNNAYPLPNMDSILDKLWGARYLSKIDLKAAYHQIPMARESKKYSRLKVVAIYQDAIWTHERPYDLSATHRLTSRP